jgi:hypothetical protein
MTHPAVLEPGEPDEAAFPEPPGGGILLALAAGVAASGAVLLLVLAPPLAVVWLALAAIGAGIALARGLYVIPLAAAAVAPALVTPALATCLTGYWGFLAPVLVALGAALVVLVPVGFGVGRLLRRRAAGRLFPVLRVVLVLGAALAALGWGILIADALDPGVCPPGP